MEEMRNVPTHESDVSVEDDFSVLETPEDLSSPDVVDGVVPRDGGSSLQSLVQIGFKSEAEQGVALRAVQMGLATEMCQSVHAVHSQVSRASRILQRANDRYVELLEAEIETMPSDMLGDVIAGLEGRMLRSAEAMRKIVQGRSIFPEDTLSDTDRQVLRLLGSLRTTEEKEEFIRVIEERFGRANTFGDGVDAGDVEGDDDVLDPEVDDALHPVDAYHRAVESMQPTGEEGVSDDEFLSK